MAKEARPHFDPAKHHRRSIRIKGYDYAQTGAYFVTIVTSQRDCLFGEIVAGEMVLSDFGKIAEACWRAIPEHFPAVELGAYVIMPNHVHGIIIIDESVGTRRADDVGTGAFGRGAALLRPYMRPNESFPDESRPNVKPGSLGAIVRSYKSAVSYRIRKEHNTTEIWQRNYYEHIIRDDKDLQRITDYINTNPLRWNEDDENPIKARPVPPENS